MGIFNNLGIRFREIEMHKEHPDVLLERYKLKKKEGVAGIDMQIVYHSVFLKIPHADHKWWSPELTVNIEEHEEGALIRKVTGPNPGTFTFAMFVIIGAITIFFFALMFAFSQIQLSVSATGSLLVVGGSVVVAVLMVMILGWGRKKAEGQMKVLQDFADKVLSD